MYIQFIFKLKKNTLGIYFLLLNLKIIIFILIILIFKKKSLFIIEICILYYKFQNPALAQLEEHLTVEVTWKSRGPWFKSGKPDFFFRLI